MESEKEYVIDISELSRPMYLSLGVGALMLILYFMVIGEISLIKGLLKGQSFLIYMLLVFATIIVSTIVHEALHAITFLLLTKCSLSCIKFGFYKGNPYCHCQSKIKVKHYKIVLLTPLLVLGVLIYILGLYTNESLFILVGIFNMVSAIGDICIWRLLKKLPNENHVKDHPSKIGFYLCN